MFLALVALSGSAVRLVRAHSASSLRGPRSDSVALDRQLVRVDSARTSHRLPPGPIDMDRATAAEIEALPGIGPSLARRIVANRDSSGAFGGLDALCDVRGVGRAMAERLRPLVTFTGAPRPLSDGCGDASKDVGKTRRARSREPR